MYTTIRDKRSARPVAPWRVLAVGVAAASLLLLVPGAGPARADGMYAPAIGEAVANTSDQQGILLFGRGWTRLILRTGYRGNGKPFSWVIPTWGTLRREDVTAVDATLFEALDDFTAPQLVTYELACGTSLGCAAEEGDEASVLEPAVTVFDSFRVAGYEIEIVAADAAEALVQWLEGKGYQIPEGGPEVFGDYVERGFRFVTVRFAPRDDEPPEGEGEGEGEGTGTSEGEGENYGGNSGGSGAEDLAPALSLRFPVMMNTFPLQISRLSSDRPTEILLFTLGSSRYRVDPSLYATMELHLPDSYQGSDFTDYYRTQLQAALARAGGKVFAVEYAGPLPPDLERLIGLDELREGEQTPLFLTRLHARLEPAQMAHDVVLEPQPGEASLKMHRIRIVAGHEPAVGELAAVLPFDLLLIVGLAQLAQRRRSRRGHERSRR